ncbi:MAG: MFS transporter [Promethearchaeota archaeon]
MSNNQTNVKANIWKYYVFEVLWPSNLFLPIFQVFMLARNITITQMAIIGIVWTIAYLGTEVPSGVLADRWGRKKTLFLSQSLLIISTIITIFAQTIWIFMISSIFSGFWLACYSGTGVAFFYDSLVELKNEKDYEKLWGRMGFITIPVHFLFATFSSLLFLINSILPYILTIILAFLSLFVILSFVEPKYHKTSIEHSIFLHFKESIKKVLKNDYIAFIVLFGAILGFALEYLSNNIQLYLTLIKVHIALFGVIFAFGSLIEGIGRISANRIKKIFDYRIILTFTLSAAVVSIIGLSFLNNYYGVILYALIFFISGLFRIIQRGYIHKRVESYNRATVDSVSTFIMTILVILLSPIAGVLADLYSIRLAFLLVGCVLAIYGVYYFSSRFNKKHLFE